MAHNHKLMGVFISYEGYSNFSQIKETLTQVYGKGNKPNKYIEKYNWYGGKVSIALHYKKPSREGVISYTYKPIYDEYKRAKESAAKKGAADL
jgi:hypothetical protein